MKLDKEIKALRKIYQQTRDDELAVFVLKKLNSLQRERFKKTGKFLLHNNGSIYTYSQEDSVWFRW